MKICVFGAGAIGGHLAVRLERGGAAVSVIARGEHLHAIQRSGLRLITPAEDMIARITATDSASDLGPQDAVLVAVKAPALPMVAAMIQPLLGPHTTVAFFLNGIPWWYYHGHGGPLAETDISVLDPAGALRRTIGFERAIGAVVYSACTVTAPGVIKVEHATNRFVLGEPGGQRSARVAAIAEPLERGGVTVEVTDAIRSAIWSKLALNLGLGPLGVLSASAPRDFLTEEACQACVRTVVAEAAAIAAAMGHPVAASAEAQIRMGRTSGHKTSILQDLELGRPMEIDALYTVPLQMARNAGVDTPGLDLLAALTRLRARSAGLYGG